MHWIWFQLSVDSKEGQGMVRSEGFESSQRTELRELLAFISKPYPDLLSPAAKSQPLQSCERPTTRGLFGFVVVKVQRTGSNRDGDTRSGGT